MRAALVSAYVSEYGAQPGANELGFMLAQIHLETRGFQAIYCNNVGNITISENAQSGLAYRPFWYERPAGGFSNARLETLHQDMLDGRAPTAFRAYSTLQEGARDYVHRLRVQFPEIPKAMRTGDAYAVGAAISERYCPKCFGASETANLGQMATRYGAPGPSGVGAPDVIGGAVLLLVLGATLVLFMGGKHV